MSYAPQSLLAARAYIQAHTGLAANALGIVGDPAHGNEGYHVGWDRLQNGYGAGDYSWGESPRDRSYSGAASALDIGRFARLRELSVWLVEQCRTGTPDTADIREVIYSPDGRTVRRWDRLGIRSGGDGSHVDHTHVSYFRDSEGRDKTAVFRRFFEGDDDVAAWGVILTSGRSGPTSTDNALLTIYDGMQLDVKPALAALHKKIDGLVVALQALAAGGTSVDTAALMAHIDAIAAEESQTVAELSRQVADLRHRLAEAAQAEADQLKA